MADTEDDVLELEQDQVIEGEQEQEANTEAQAAEGDDELEVFIGDEAAPASAEGDSSVIRQMRTKLREIERENAELKRGKEVQKVDPGPKPSLESCEWDEERFETELDTWKANVAKANEAETADQERARKANEAWQTDLARFNTQKAGLKFADAQEAEEIAVSKLSLVQQAALVQAAENPALVLYSLGKHPAKLEQIAAIENPIKLAAAVAKLEGLLKVAPRRKPPEPEEVARGSGSVSTAKEDKTLQRLEAEFEKTGDRSKIIAYKAQMKAQARN